MDEKLLKELEQKLEGLGKAIDQKLESHSKEITEATSKEVKEAALKAAKEAIEPELAKYNELNGKYEALQKQNDELDVKLQKMSLKDDSKPKKLQVSYN